jgi:hypothetical protein
MHTTLLPHPARALLTLSLLTIALAARAAQLHADAPYRLSLPLISRAALAEVPRVELHPALVAAAQHHADYDLLNSSDPSAWTNGPHGEVAGKPGFTGTTFGDRVLAARFLYPASAEVIDYLDDPTASVDDLMATVFHRMALLFPWNQYAGYGHARGAHTAVDVIDFGRGAADPPEPPRVIVFPAAGQTGVPIVGWAEAPSTLPPGSPYPFGYPVTAQLGSGTTLAVSAAELRDSAGAQLAVYPNPAGCDTACYALIPVSPLAPSASYTAHIAGAVHGAPFDLTWTFTTAACGEQISC